MLTSSCERVDVARARLVVDPRDDRRGEVEDLLELLRRHVEQVADAARDALEEPDVADRGGEVDVAHALAAHLGARDLDAAALADDALVADALVLAAVALPVLRRTEDALAEQAVLLGLQRAVVDRLRLGDLARAPGADLLGGGEADLDGVEVVDVDQCCVLRLSSSSAVHVATVDVDVCRRRRPSSPASASPSPRSPLGAVLGAVGRLVGRLAVGRAHAGEVDAELLGGAQQVVVLVAHLGARALLGDDVDVERQRLHLLQQHLERLGDRRLGDVLALDDRLVGLHAADRVVGLDREHLLERVGGAVRLQGPHLHLAEALAAELRLAAQRLLGDERVRAGRAGVDLVVDEVEQLQDVHVADRHLLLERLARAPVEERELAARPARPPRRARSMSIRMRPSCSCCHFTSAVSTSSTVAPSNTGVET